MEKDCLLCEERGKIWKGDDPKCAFIEDKFDDNWNCASMNILRDIAVEHYKIYYDEDQSFVSIFIPAHILDDLLTNDTENPDEPFYYGFFLTMSWYKDRGRTDFLHLLPISDYKVDKYEIGIPITREIIQKIIDYFNSVYKEERKR
jgi:hypothetical protein